MGLIAMFGIENSGLELAVNLLLLFLVVIWLALVYWTYSDARRRIADPMLVACATAASLFPFIGTIVYLIVRPPSTSRTYASASSRSPRRRRGWPSSSTSTASTAGSRSEKAFLRCPSCLRRLKEPCTVCGKPLDPRWKICPYCEAEVGQAAEGRRPRPRRAAAAAGGGVPPRPSAARPSGSARQGAASEGTAERPAVRPSRDRPQSAG